MYILLSLVSRDKSIEPTHSYFDLGSSPGKYESTHGGGGGRGVPLPLHVSFAHHTLSLLPPTGSPTASRPLPETYGVTTALLIHICNPSLLSCCLRAHNTITLRKEESQGGTQFAAGLIWKFLYSDAVKVLARDCSGSRLALTSRTLP